MCKAMEELIKEEVTEQNKDLLKNMFENGGSLELAISMFKDFSEDVIRKIYDEVKNV